MGLPGEDLDMFRVLRTGPLPTPRPWTPAKVTLGVTVVVLIITDFPIGVVILAASGFPLLPVDTGVSGD